MNQQINYIRLRNNQSPCHHQVGKMEEEKYVTLFIPFPMDETPNRSHANSPTKVDLVASLIHNTYST